MTPEQIRSAPSQTAEMNRLLDLPSGPRLRSLRGRFVRTLAALIALVLLVFALVLVFLGRSYTEAQLIDRARGYATLAAPDVAAAWDHYGRSGAAKFRRILFRTASLNGDLRALAIYDASGDLLFHTDTLAHDPRVTSLRSLGPSLNPPETESATRALPTDAPDKIHTWIEADVRGDRYFVISAPYFDDLDALHSSVTFYFTDDRLDQSTLQAITVLVGLGMLGLLLGIGCAFFLARESLEPLEELTRGAGKMAIGLLEHRVDLTTGDEFEILSQALDQLAQRLQHTIADLESSNADLQELNRQLQELDQVKSDLLANVSHELRTPLTAIGGYVEALQTELLGEVEEDQHKALTVMERNVLRLRNMIDQLLNYSRMNSGRLELELLPFDLAPIASHVMEELRAIHADSHTLIVDVSENLPQVYGDAARIGQVLENLLTNAIKFTPTGGRVEISAQEVKNGVEICVSDTGIGIPPGARERIFDRFFQVDAGTRRRFGGIGLGLAIVREIIERHHAKITLESEVDRGTTFRFALPTAAERTGIIPLPGTRLVALIDGDADFVGNASAYLSRRGFAVETAATAEEGELLVRRTMPDVVLIDRLLPDDDGFDVLTRLQEDPTTAKVLTVVVSQRKDRALAKRLGVSTYLVKPIRLEEIVEVLEELLPRKASPDLKKSR